MAMPIHIVSVPGTLDVAVEFGLGWRPPGAPQMPSPGTAGAAYGRLPGTVDSSREAAAMAWRPVTVPQSRPEPVRWHPVMGAPSSGS
ncbi:hypothetical protein IU501_26055 [Nocardia otitidiscaviarum]|uniref:hypothetical protein n=1 Tax=Nocardia otitidiscaviarum TaxID=1823 RepID=UPI0011DDC774|nr:hypothetical protein [Nocardia otitidiscaviarum]MBF6136451.1 hypothetical protein [Nocardia otitidiscaviarum]MBF6484653.1 hypothetical protein [Nocardia otitidiscaviarum]